jgi:hypothetical protein
VHHEALKRRNLKSVYLKEIKEFERHTLYTKSGWGGEGHDDTFTELGATIT